MMASFDTFNDWDTQTEYMIADEGNGSRILQVIHINVRSLKKHWDELNVYIKDSLEHTDIIILTEINVEANEPLPFSLDGFNAISVRRNGRRGGGILIFIRNTWLYERIEVSLHQAEVMVINMNKSDLSFTLCAVYRPPSGNISAFNVELVKLLTMFNNNDHIILAGDFNIDVMCPSRSGVTEYLDILYSYGLQNLIDAYTREEYLAEKITKTCIDHIIVRTSNFKFLAGIIKQKVADHFFVTLKIVGNQNFDRKRQEYKHILDNWKVDHNIKKFNWDALLNLDHISLYKAVVKKFRNIYDGSMKRVKLEQRKPGNNWMDQEILELSSEKCTLWNRCKQNPDDRILKEEFRKVRNRLTAKIRLAKKKFHSMQLKQCGQNLRKTWDVVNQIIGKPPKDSVDDFIQKNFGEHNINKLSNEFNRAFVKEVQDLRDQSKNTAEGPKLRRSQQNSAFLPQMSESDLKDILEKMSTTKPAGYDQIRIRDIRLNYDSLKKVLLAILNGIFDTGTIPNEMKVSIIRPIHKKGNKKEVTNYRPIALLSAISQIMEKFVFKHMTSFCEKFSLINNCQYGFRHGKSMTLLLEDITEFINGKLDNNEIVLGLFLDLTKAYDTIDYEILLNKLEKLGFRGPFQKFFKDYFYNRAQRVKIGNNVSDAAYPTCGIPQGSVLGPMLFNIYVNDLGALPLKSKLYQYADDTALVLADKNYDSALNIFQEDLKDVMTWFSKNKIFVNKKKTCLMCFRTHQKRINPDKPLFLHSSECVHCSCLPLPYARDTKYLGLYFDEHLSWDSHIDYLLKKLRTVSGYLYKLRSSADINLRRTVYQMLGESKIRYGITTYGSCSSFKKKKINNIQKRMLKNITYGTRYEDLTLEEQLDHLDLLAMDNLRKFVILTKHYFTHDFKLKSNKQKQLRHTERLHIPRVYTNYGLRQRKYYVPKYFNDIPDNLLTLQSISSVKKEMKKLCKHTKVS